ncbi:hypothetical protein B0H14DRAFT_3682575 [Mycena olivaceomarginata]|nr:hypothetical protein B0H14DRAFT_3682575 [Mycena olivaceomarginata]
MSDEVFPPARDVRLTPGTRWRAGGIASVVRRSASDSAAVLDLGAALLGFTVVQSWHTCACEGFGFEYTQRLPHHNDRCCHRCGRDPTPRHRSHFRAPSPSSHHLICPPLTMAPPALRPAVACAYVPPAPKTPRGACVTPVLPCCARRRARPRLARVLARRLGPSAHVDRQRPTSVTRRVPIPARLARFHKASYAGVDEDAAGVGAAWSGGERVEGVDGGTARAVHRVNYPAPKVNTSGGEFAQGTPWEAEGSYFSPATPTPYSASFAPAYASDVPAACPAPDFCAQRVWGGTYADDETSASAYAPNTFSPFSATASPNSIEASAMASPRQIGGPLVLTPGDYGAG